MEIRSWDRADLPELVRVDQAATELLRTAGLDLPDDDPTEVLRDAELPEAEWGPRLRRIWAAEAAAGIAVAPRMAMIHPLG